MSDRGEKRPRDSGDAEAGGTDTQELSMSVEETNKMRAALGLKPLKTGPSKTTEREATEKKRHTDERQRKEREQEANEHRARIEAQREKRTLDEKLRRTRKLGEAMDEEEDDMAAWVAKSRVVDEQRKLEADKRAAQEAAAQAKLKAKQADSDEEGDYSAAELAGMKVKHGYGDLVEGETVILTLADRAILDERGELNEGDDDEELENVLKAEDRKRNKARRAATKKGKPLFGEDGKKQSLLDKYDEEEEEATLRLDTGGGVVAEQQRQQEEIRRKLAAGNAVLESAATPAAIPSATSGSDFYTQSEVAAFAKPKRKKKDRKLRSKAGADEDEEKAGGTEDLMAMLEAEAEAAGGSGTSDLGTRGEGQGRQVKKAQEQADAVKEKRARFDAALEKANWASLALRPAAAASTSGRGADAEVVGVADDADDELYESLSRARRQAQQQQQGASTSAKAGPTLLEDLAASAAERREADEAALRAQLAAGAEVYTEATEFVRNIGADHSSKDDVGTTAAARVTAAAAMAAAAATAGGVRSSLPPPPPPPPGAGRKGADDDGEGGYMGMDVDDNEAGGSGDGAAALPPAKWGAWVTAEEAEQAAEETQQHDKAKQRSKANKTEAAAAAAAAEAEDSVTRERNVGKGLSSVLALLHEKGDLSDRNKVVWAGRTNDMKPVMLIGLDDVYQGGGHDERMARSIEMALTQTDVLGRVMTPKQRFREQCYRFHGIFPSKNQQEKRIRKEAEAVKTRQAATSENPSAELDRLQTIQKQTGKAHVVLSGKDALKPQSVKPPSGLGGGVTPVVGDRKVEMMLGIKKAAVHKEMPPPPPRKPAA